jgi:hypothetical protein
VNEKKDIKAETKKALAKGKDKGGKQGIENFFRAVHNQIKNLLGGE